MEQRMARLQRQASKISGFFASKKDEMFRE
jgi:hypothetical protein